MKEEKYIVSEEQGKLDLIMVHGYLSKESYWARGIPEETFRRSVKNSLCFGIYTPTEQVGFARVVTDKATFAYLADVFIIPAFRGKGLSRRLLDYIVNFEDLQGLRRWVLGTADAHGLYMKYGFTPLGKPERCMEKHNPDVYKAKS